MSQENVEIVRDLFSATNERDFDRALAHYADEVELLVPSGIRAGTFRGREAVGDWYGDWFGTFDRDARFNIEEAIALDDGSVLVVAQHHARGKASGVEIKGEVVWVYRLRGGKIVRVEGHESRAEALEAVELTE